MRLLSPLKPYLRLQRRRAFLPGASLPAHTADCPECGLSNAVPRLHQGAEACCRRCGCGLVRVERNPFQLPPALAAGTLVLLLLVYGMMFVTVDMPGLHSRLTLAGMVSELLFRDWGFLAEVMLLFTFGTPLFFLLLLLYVYAALNLRVAFPGLRGAVKTMLRLQQWMMADVFFISTLVAYIKLKVVSQVTFGTAFWLMIPMTLLLVRTSQSVPAHWLYFQVGRLTGNPALSGGGTGGAVCCRRCLFFRPAAEENCGICGTPLYFRRPHSMQTAAAFLLAAAILYLPANLLPIMISANPANVEISTILSGIIYMWRDGDRLIAAIIFSASIMVPTLKILSMAVLLASARFGLPASAGTMSHLYRITEAVGRWSMIDIFVIIMMMSAFDSPIARVTPGPAALYFCMVVLLTMLSAHYFDPRLLWDKNPKETL